MGLNGEFHGWVRTILLGLGIGVAYADLRAQVGQVQDDLRGLKMEFRQVADRQATNLPKFERLMLDVDKLEKKVDEFLNPRRR